MRSSHRTALHSAAFVVVVGLAAGAFAKAPFAPPSDALILERIRAAQHDQDLADRLRVVSDPFLGAPYALSPLGEGQGEDPDPRLRYDAFDCTTFVETTVALAIAKDIGEARRLLDLIRYRHGEPGFLARRHFPEAEWIPELQELGFLEDITRQVGGDNVVVEKKRLDAAVWERRKRPSHLELPAARIPSGDFALDVWPLDDARAHQRRIPPGTLLNLVRVDFKSVPVRVSHQGIVIEKKGALYMRHAADRMFHSVVDEPLDHFFLRMQKYKKWPVAGVNLARVQEPAGWRGLMAAAAKSDDDEHAAKGELEQRLEAVKQ